MIRVHMNQVPSVPCLVFKPLKCQAFAGLISSPSVPGLSARSSGVPCSGLGHIHPASVSARLLERCPGFRDWALFVLLVLDP